MLMATVDELLAQALRLSTDDRARIAHELLLSLDERAEDPEAETAWGEEISRRAQEVLDGTVELVSLEEARKQVEERLKRVRRQR